MCLNSATAYMIAHEDIRCVKVFKMEDGKIQSPWSEYNWYDKRGKLKKIYHTNKPGFHCYPFDVLDQLHKILKQTANIYSIVEVIIPKGSSYVRGTQTMAINDYLGDLKIVGELPAFASKTIKIV